MRTEWLERIQYLSIGLALIIIVISFFTSTNSNQSAFLSTSHALFAIFFLILYNILHFLKIDLLDDLREKTSYNTFSVWAVIFLQAAIFTYLLWNYYASQAETTDTLLAQPYFKWGVIPITLSLTIVSLNLYLPAKYQIDDLIRKAHLRKSQSLISLRKDIQYRTELLLASGILPELEQARKGDKVPQKKLEDAVRMAVDKIGGIEHILQYMVLDKYLELLETSDESSSKGVLRRWAMSFWVIIVAIYNIGLAIFNSIDKYQDLFP